MKQVTEKIERIPEPFVQDECMQVFLAYQNYLMFYGEKGLLYYKNKNDILNSKEQNSYLTDERKDVFPYSNIAEHIELNRGRKVTMANQILEFEKPYIQISDGNIQQLTAFKEWNAALVHIRTLYPIEEPYKYIATYEELANYLKNGILPDKDDRYNLIQIFNPNYGSLLGNYPLSSEQQLIDTQKRKLAEIQKYVSFDKKLKLQFQKALASLNNNEIEPLNIINYKYMLKYKDNGEMELEIFKVMYLRQNKYSITVANLPIQKLAFKDLSSSNLDIEDVKNPRISPYLNPGISRTLIKSENQKFKR